MWGALIGDVMGSIYEGVGRFCEDPEQVDLWSPKGHFSDDSVLTAAIAEWCMFEGPLAVRLHDIGGRHLGRGFGGGFLQWLMAESPPPPYQSYGNGSAMRVSPVALWADTEEEILALAQASAMPTHDHPQGVRGAQMAAWATRKAFEIQDPVAWKAEVDARWQTTLDAFDPRAVRAFGFQIECEATVRSALWCAAHGGSVEGTLRLVLALGGDTDTMGAIAGAMAEGLYGLPDGALTKLAGYFSPDDGVWSAIQAFYDHPRVRRRLEGWNRWPTQPWPLPFAPVEPWTVRPPAVDPGAPLPRLRFRSGDSPL